MRTVCVNVEPQVNKTTVRSVLPVQHRTTCSERERECVLKFSSSSSLSFSWKFRFASVWLCGVWMLRSVSNSLFRFFLRCILVCRNYLYPCLTHWELLCFVIWDRFVIFLKADLCLNLYPCVIKYYLIIFSSLFLSVHITQVWIVLLNCVTK